MKNIILIIGFLGLLTSAAHAAPISIGNIDNIFIANKLLGTSSVDGCSTTDTTTTSCDFTNTPGTYLTDSEVAAIVTSYNPDDASYVLSPDVERSYIELGFVNANDKKMVMTTGANDDLVVFIAGNTTSFKLDVFSETGSLINSNTYFIPTPTETDSGYTVLASNELDADWLCVGGDNDGRCTNGSALSAIFVDLDDGLTEALTVGSLHISLGYDFIDMDNNLSTNPRLLFAGGLHAPMVVVPLPLPVILFSSGLAMLGWFGRRRTT